MYFCNFRLCCDGLSCEKEGDSLKGFYSKFISRRMKRLLPAVVTLFLVCSLISLLIIPPVSSLQEIGIKTGIFSLIGFSNIYLFWESTDYFGLNAELNPFTHTWSLGVEEQFYLVFPLLFILCNRGEGEKSV